jgi:hypothetical protein
MHMSRIRVRAVLAAAFVALFGVVPRAAAQDFTTVTSAPVGYRVDVPVEWQLQRNDAEMLMVGTTDAVIIASAWDLMANEQRHAALPEDFHRRIVTERFMGSDSTLLAGVAEALANAGTLQPDGQVAEIRTLGGERAGYMRAQWVRNGDTGWAHAYMTVKDGIMYALLHVVGGTDPDKYKELVDRVQQSFVLAAAPPSS